MYYFGVIIPAKLSLTWDAVIGAITLIGFFWGIYKIIGSKVSKVRYYEDLKQLKNELKEIEEKMKSEIDCLELNNTASHGKLSAESERYFQILRESMKETYEGFRQTIASVDEKINILINRGLIDKK